MLGLVGQPFWQDESYDQLVRNRTEFDRIANYIEMNPVKAGLVAKPEDFPWSSARADWQSSRSLPSCPTRPEISGSNGHDHLPEVLVRYWCKRRWK